MTVQWLDDKEFNDLRRKCYKIGKMTRQHFNGSRRMAKSRFDEWLAKAGEIGEEEPLRRYV